VLVDRVPRPADARIRVTNVKFSGPKPEYDAESDTGEVRFTVKLKPGEAKAVGIEYVVEHPSTIEAIRGKAE